MVEDLVENERFIKAIRPRLPLRRLAEPADYAGIAVHLMSDLSGFHTGDAITIDGGFSVSYDFSTPFSHCADVFLMALDRVVSSGI